MKKELQYCQKKKKRRMMKNLEEKVQGLYLKGKKISQLAAAVKFKHVIQLPEMKHVAAFFHLD